MNKIRFVCRSGSKRENSDLVTKDLHYKDEQLPFIPALNDQVYLVADKEERFGEFTVTGRTWFPILKLHDVVLIHVSQGNPRFISGGYNLSETKSWVKSQENSDQWREAEFKVVT
jgi:hypothetical protein